MYALPGQTLTDLATGGVGDGLSFAPPHLSIYHLTIRPNTRFASSRRQGLPDADLASDMLDLHDRAHCRRRPRALRGLGLCPARAPPPANLNYWQFGDYLGIGAGAHSKLSFPHRVLRQVRWREPGLWHRPGRAGRQQ